MPFDNLSPSITNVDQNVITFFVLIKHLKNIASVDSEHRLELFVAAVCYAYRRHVNAWHYLLLLFIGVKMQ